MFRRLLGFWCGYRVITVPRNLRGVVYDLLFRLGIEFFGERNNKKGELSICVLQKYVPLLECELTEAEVCGVCISDRRGFPVFLRFLRHRPGFVLGTLLLLVWWYVSGRIIWDIRIDGNTVTPDSEIIALLTDLGCGYGDWIPGIDYDDVHAKFLARSETVGWLSVFMHGTVAEVQVRELVKPQPSDRAEGVYANVVAAEEGEIEIVRVFEGQSAVKKGDVVKAGDVVISGVVEKKDMNLPDGGVRYEYASGEVIAKTARSIEVEISLSREEKVYTGAETVRKRINFFGNVVNLFQNSGIVYKKYDKIDRIKRISVFGLCFLPFWIEETVYREYAYETHEVSADRAAADAFAELRRLTDEAVGNGELLQRTVSASLADGKYRIRCLLYIERDIGTTKEFTVTE